MPLSPNGFPVLLSFDIDAETMWTARDPKNAERPIVMSQGAYGWKVRHAADPRPASPGTACTSRSSSRALVMEQRPAMVEEI